MLVNIFNELKQGAVPSNMYDLNEDMTHDMYWPTTLRTSPPRFECDNACCALILVPNSVGN